MKILFLSSWFPFPPDNGAKIRVTNLLGALLRDHQVTLIAAHHPGASVQTEPAIMDRPGLKVVPVPWRPTTQKGLPRLLGFVSPRLGWVLFAPDRGMSNVIAREMRSTLYDVAIAFELTTAIYIAEIRGIPALLEDIELGASLYSGDRPASAVTRLRKQLYSWKLQRCLRSLLPKFAAGTVVSEAEKQYVGRMVPSFPVEVIPNCLDYDSYKDVSTPAQPRSLIFSGSLTFGANYEAAKYLLQEVYPRVRQQLPDIRLTITGDHGNLPLPGGSLDNGVLLTGRVPDVRPVIAGSWVSVVPLLTGGGTRFKILEAMALGTPVVSTTKGAEGLDVEHGRHLLIADSSRDFAAAILQICQDTQLRSRLGEEGRRLVAERYSWDAVAPRFVSMVQRIASRHRVVTRAQEMEGQ